MKLESIVTRILIKSMPQTLIRKLQNDYEFSAFAELPIFRFGGVGSFGYDVILKTLTNAKETGEQVEIIAGNGIHYFLERTQDGVCLTPVDSSHSNPLKIQIFSFLDSDKAIRIGALNDVMGRCWPSLQLKNQWQPILEERPLSEMDIAGFMSQISQNPGHFLSTMAGEWRSGAEMDLSSFIPTSLAYYTDLVAPPPQGMGADDWIDEILIPQLKHRLRDSLHDGLKLALALNVDSRLSPSALISSETSHDELAAVLQKFSATRSPLALLGILEIAISQMAKNEQFHTLALDILDRLAGENSNEIGNAQAWQLMPVAIKSGLNKMSTEEGIWLQPPFWRRLVAFAHAHFLTETLGPETDDFDHFIAWMRDQESEGELPAMLLDFTKEPMWRAWDMNLNSFRMLVIRRLKILKDTLDAGGFELGNNPLFDRAFESIKKEGGVVEIDTPGPLQNGLRMRSKTGVTSSSSDAEASFFSSAISALEVDPLGNAWHGLAWSSRYLCFDDELLNSLTALAAQLSLGETTEDRQKFFGAVEKAAEISATQPCENLANAVTDTLARYAPQFASARDSELGYLLLMICSGAIIDATKWREWIEKRMADYAFLIAKGEPCSQLLQSLNHLQKLIPISDRCFGRAKKFASGGI